MRTPSIRTLAALAYERGEEFDPALMLSPALAEQLDSASTAATNVLAPSRSDEGRFEGGGLVFWPLDARDRELAELIR